MVNRHVLGCLLNGDQRRHPFQQKVEVIAAEEGVGAVGIGATSRDRLHGLDQTVLDVAPSAERVPLDFAHAHVVDDDGDDGVQLVAMPLHVGLRSQQALLLAAKENEAHRAPGFLLGRREQACQLDHQRDVGTVVEAARPQVPRIEMRADDHDLLRRILLRRLGAANLGHHVVGFERSAGLVGEGEAHPDTLARVQQPQNPLGVFARDQRRRHQIEPAVDNVHVAVE